ncbi:10232_t:CDS:2 [Ambispora gerdemannii]|uniref:10232_t:CDS:1 n=1 Tax=Ambispora gerdemannii TaxID=144530 RepID=A0A9N8ZDL8_9GLOM|nr:10232_t:CDS:2 [Ambispora gerdemannii]
MTDYFVDFINDVPDDTLTFGVYQTFPNTPGIDSVAWLRADVPESGTAGVKFTETYCVVNADFYDDDSKGRYKASQTFNTNLGTAWELIDKDTISQFSKKTSSSNADNLIVIKNNSKTTASLGIGMSGKLSAIKRKVYVGATAAFKVTPVIYVGIFTDLEIGEVITDDVILSNSKITFDGNNVVTIRAYLKGHQFKLDVSYSNRASSSL